MAKILGIGGVFFKSGNPEKLAKWYKKYLGLDIDSQYWGTSMPIRQLPDNAYTVWSPFDKKTTYFDPSKNSFMINFIVDDVYKALEQVKEGGAKLVGKPEDSEYGLFGWFLDPEENKIELWQPPKKK